MIIQIKLDLAWNFLIKFEDKEELERRTIRIRFDVKHVV